jgi:hypothetical protein
VTFVHTGILRWYFILARGKWLHSIRPSVHSDFHFSGGLSSETWLQRPSVHSDFHLLRGPVPVQASTRFCHFVFLKKWKKKKKMTDWLHSVRTDFRYIALRHCIALHCIACIVMIALHCVHALMHCIALHVHMCIALHYVYCITYWLNVMLIVRHVCSWIVPSVTFNFFAIECITSDRICVFVCLCLSVNFFFVGPPYGRTDLDCMLNWN